MYIKSIMNSEPKIILPKSDEKLLAECEIQTFRATGKGGQHVNTTDSAVRLIFLPNHIVVSSQKERSQYLNKMECIKKLRKKVELLNYVPRKRIPTKISKSKKSENLNKKSKHGEKKKLRGPIKPGE